MLPDAGAGLMYAVAMRKPCPRMELEGSIAAVGFDYCNCNRLFAIEAEIEKLTADERKVQRQEQSRPVLEAYWVWLETVDPLRGSKLGEAITYSLNQREFLGEFLKDGRIEISNNRSENALRPFVNGRKAWLFADTKKGAQFSAIVYSIVESAKANKINPYMYLVHIFQKMPGLDFKNEPALLEKLMPWSAELPDYCRL